jgi:hypothetical protein
MDCAISLSLTGNRPERNGLEQWNEHRARTQDAAISLAAA